MLYCVDTYSAAGWIIFQDVPEVGLRSVAAVQMSDAAADGGDGGKSARDQEPFSPDDAPKVLELIERATGRMRVLLTKDGLQTDHKAALEFSLKILDPPGWTQITDLFIVEKQIGLTVSTSTCRSG